MKKKKYLKNCGKIANWELDELFEFVNKWSEKQEANGFYVSGILSMTMFEDCHDELVESRWYGNLNPEQIDIHMDGIKEQICEECKKCQ